MTTGQRIKNLRKEKKWTQSELAQKANVARSTVIAWEKDNFAPEGDRLYNLADALNVSTDYILCRTDDPTPIRVIHRSMEDVERDARNRPVYSAREQLRRIMNFLEYENIEPDTNENMSSQVPDGARPDFLKSSGKVIQVPVYGKELAACCGDGFPNFDQIYAEAEEFIAMPSGFLGPVSSDPQYKPFIIYAEGDSMEGAGIIDGAQVIINPYDDVLDGDSALIEFAMTPVTKSIAIKRVYWKDHCGIEIRSADGTGWSRTFNADDFEEKSVRIIGKVEWIGNKPKRG